MPLTESGEPISEGEVLSLDMLRRWKTWLLACKPTPVGEVDRCILNRPILATHKIARVSSRQISLWTVGRWTASCAGECSSRNECWTHLCPVFQFFDPASPQVEAIRDFFAQELWISGGIFSVIAGLIRISLLKFRSNDKLPTKHFGSHRKEIA